VLCVIWDLDGMWIGLEIETEVGRDKALG